MKTTVRINGRLYVIEEDSETKILNFDKVISDPLYLHNVQLLKLSPFVHKTIISNQ